MNAMPQRLTPQQLCLEAAFYRSNAIACLRSINRFILAAALTATASAQTDGDSKGDDNDSAAIHRLVYLGRSGPLFLKLDLTIDGQPISEFRRSYVLRQFEQFDKDRRRPLARSRRQQFRSVQSVADGKRLLR